MITNSQILRIMKQKEEYEKQLLNLDTAKAICEYLIKDTDAVNKIQEDYNKTMIKYNQWLDSEVNNG